mmetsp:Transcript_19208/g.46360  ORF Transcript_19208/g.46360 Transcript_19208/m.46360 type:complete len:585 (-) Transcript_19208:968-2722(-)
MTTSTSSAVVDDRSAGNRPRNSSSNNSSSHSTDVEDYAVPPFDDTTSRTSTIVVATFNLAATIVGGGVLSLPYAFSKTGLVLGSVLMVVAAVITERSLYLFCLCSRMTGATTFGEVGEAAFGGGNDDSGSGGGGGSGSGSGSRGKYVEWMLSLLLGVFLVFVIVAYMVLIEDIWTSIVKSIVVMMNDPSGEYDVDTVNSRSVLLVVVIMMFPFFVQRRLHALRFNCYVGYTSITVLCLALVHHAWITSTSTSAITMTSSTASLDTDVSTASSSSKILLWSTNIEDVLIAFPIITLSFLSIFNVLPIQNALIIPTRRRTLQVIDGAMISCFVLMLVFGIAGYVYAFPSRTEGNILNNVAPPESTGYTTTGSGGLHFDLLMFLGRIGCGVTISLAMPMMLLPCRASLLEVLDVVIYGPHHVPVEADNEEELLIGGDESTLLLADKSTTGHNIATNTNANYHATTVEEADIDLPSVDIEPRNHLTANPIVHYLSTGVLVTICYVTAVRIPGGVATVWSIIGCFMGYLLAFILPAACYIMIERRFPKHAEMNIPSWTWFSWALLLFATFVSILCTIETVQRLFFSGTK